MKKQPSASLHAKISANRSRPAYITATQLRANLPAILHDLQSRRTTAILCRWNKPAAILRGGTDPAGKPMIHFIPVQSREGRRILRAAAQSA
jgi:hypothetical protein